MFISLLYIVLTTPRFASRRARRTSLSPAPAPVRCLSINPWEHRATMSGKKKAGKEPSPIKKYDYSTSLVRDCVEGGRGRTHEGGPTRAGPSLGARHTTRSPARPLPISQLQETIWSLLRLPLSSPSRRARSTATPSPRRQPYRRTLRQMSSRQSPSRDRGRDPGDPTSSLQVCSTSFASSR